MIQASTVKVATMADDTLRLTIDIEPRHAQEAFALFGMRGSPVVIARLTQEAAKAAQQAETIAGNTDAQASDEKPVGGPLARLAGQLCNQDAFRSWLGVATADEAAQWMRGVCGIGSRAELDHSNRAERLFHEQIRIPYVAWRESRGLA